MKSARHRDCAISNYFCRGFRDIAISFSPVPTAPMYFVDKSSDFSLGPDHVSVEVLEGTPRRRQHDEPFHVWGLPGGEEAPFR